MFNDTAILKSNVHSILRGKALYGEKGDIVMILSKHEEIWIVEGPMKVRDDKGNKWKNVGTHRYAVREEDLIIQIIKNGTITN
jgi:hypothetical protein